MHPPLFWARLFRSLSLSLSPRKGYRFALPLSFFSSEAGLRGGGEKTEKEKKAGSLGKREKERKRKRSFLFWFSVFSSLGARAKPTPFLFVLSKIKKIKFFGIKLFYRR